MRCRNCSSYQPLAAPGTGTCPIGADPPAVRKIAAADPGCPEFTARRPVRRRTLAPPKPSRDAECIASAITAGFERLCGVLERAFTAGHADDDTAFMAASRAADRLDDMSDNIEKLVERFVEPERPPAEGVY